MSVKTEKISAIIDTLNRANGSSFSQFFVPSLNETLRFKPITVGKQKSLSKILIENKDKATQYDVYNKLLIDLCLDQSKFNINDLTIIDRYKVLFDVFTVNNYDSNIEYKCENESCKKSIPTVIPYKYFADELNKIPLNSVQHTYVDGNKTYDFTLSYPKVKRVTSLYKTENSQANDVNGILLSSLEYVKLFIEKLVLREGDTEILNINFNEMSVAETLEIISSIPSSTFNAFGVMEKIDEELISKISKVNHDVNCPHCGHNHPEAINLHTFFLIS